MNKQSLQIALLIAGLFMVSGCLGKHEITPPTGGGEDPKPVVKTIEDKKAPTAPTDIEYDTTTKELKWTASTDEDAKEGDAPITYYIYTYAEKAVTDASISKDASKYNIQDPKAYHKKVDTNKVEIDWSAFKDNTTGDYPDFLTVVILAVDKDGMRAVSAPTEKTVVEAPVNAPVADASPPTAPTDVKFEKATLTLSWKDSTDDVTTDPKKMKYYVFVSQGATEPDTSDLAKAITHVVGVTKVVFTQVQIDKILVIKTNDASAVVHVHVIAVDEADKKSPPGKLPNTIPSADLVIPAGSAYNDYPDREDYSDET